MDVDFRGEVSMIAKSKLFFDSQWLGLNEFSATHYPTCYPCERAIDEIDQSIVRPNHLRNYFT